MARTICLIFTAPDIHEAAKLLSWAIKSWRGTIPKLAFS